MWQIGQPGSTIRYFQVLSPDVGRRPTAAILCDRSRTSVLCILQIFVDLPAAVDTFDVDGHNLRNLPVPRATLASAS